MIFSLHYLPSINYFSELLFQEEILWSSNEKYLKQSYRNRTYILGAHKIETLIIPVHASSLKTDMKDVTIDNHSKWQRTHWRTIEAAYKKAPFWEHYEDYFRDIFDKKANFLVDFNVSLLTTCLAAANINTPLCRKEVVGSNQLFDLKAKKRDVSHPNYGQVRYIQNFGNDFVPNLSILDMLMCTGPETRGFLQKTKLK